MDSSRLTPSLGRTGWSDGLTDWALAGGLTLFGWIQLAFIPLFMARPRTPMPSGPAFPGPFFSFEVGHPTWAAFALVAAASLPLAWRRRFPVPVLLASVFFSGVYDLVRQPPVLIIIAPLIALYTVGTLLERRTTITATVLAVAFSLAISLPGAPASRVIAEAVRIAATFGLAAAVGDAARNRRAYVAEVEQRALEAERGREEEARRRVEEERLRIARELHDVTAHALSVIVVQAGAAEQVVERDPDAVRRALQAIRATSRSSLDELRAIVGVLRGGEDGVPMAPTGSIRRLKDLALSAEQAGISVSLDVDEVGDVPAYAEVSAYRLVQEALTNVIRHSQASRVDVRVRRMSDELTIEVTDDGVGATVPVDPPGHGIQGMRERVAALGGSFEVGPAPLGGFRVAISIPLVGGAQ